jgi:hypothetical protein
MYLAGYTRSFGKGKYDAFLIKFAPNKTLQWNVTWGGTEDEYACGMAVDGSGNVYLAGYTYESNPVASDAFLVKFSSDGTFQWDQKIGNESEDQIFGIIAGSGKKIFCIGGTRNNSRAVTNVDATINSVTGSLSNVT